MITMSDPAMWPTATQIRQDAQGNDGTAHLRLLRAAPVGEVDVLVHVSRAGTVVEARTYFGGVQRSGTLATGTGLLLEIARLVGRVEVLTEQALARGADEAPKRGWRLWR